VIAAAVILDPARPIAGLAIPRKSPSPAPAAGAEMREAKRLAWALGRADVAEIDRLNILQASLLAMRRAVAALSARAQFVLVDGNRCPAWHVPVLAIVKGDACVPAISAASMLAKVARDAELRACMTAIRYDFARHKGYPTAAHLAALRRHGPCPEHRRSFAPVAAALAQCALDHRGMP
jgi:ribonuclease HII